MAYRLNIKPWAEFLSRFSNLWKLTLIAYDSRKFEPSKFSFKANYKVQTDKNVNTKSYYLLFDAQCLQTPTLLRGIGTYSLNLIKAICNASPRKTFGAVLTNISSGFNLSQARNALENLNCSNLDILVLDVFENFSRIDYLTAQLKLLPLLETSGCIAVLSLSPLEKPQSVIAIPKSDKYLRIAILYDLIKIQFEKDFLISRGQKTSFRWLLKNLEIHDLLLPISKTSEHHWKKMVSSKTPTKVIYGSAPDTRYNPYLLNSKNFSERSGVLCIGADQPHKNLTRLIIAYAMLPRDLQLKHRLVIVGVKSVGIRKKLQTQAKKAVGSVVFPSYLTDEELIANYQSARILVMPSIVEGLSLPIFEALRNGLLVIGSINSVAEELLANKALLFDPFDTMSISSRMNIFLNDREFWEKNLENSLRLFEKYSWSKTASDAMSAIEEVAREKS